VKSSAAVADDPVPFQIVDLSQEFWDPYKNVENELFAKLFVILNSHCDVIKFFKKQILWLQICKMSVSYHAISPQNPYFNIFNPPDRKPQFSD
jgi:hypothetical protein